MVVATYESLTCNKHCAKSFTCIILILTLKVITERKFYSLHFKNEKPEGQTGKLTYLMQK